MMLVIADVLNQRELTEIRHLLDKAKWCDGRETAGYTAVGSKSNQQLRPQDDDAVRMGKTILGALSSNSKFVSFALPLKILSPMFNCYRDGGEYDFHIDNAIRFDPMSGQRIRTDVSATVFLNDPDEYAGGELIVNDTYGVERVKLPAGHAVVYPGSSLHRVCPVTRGQRLGSFLWTQSMVRNDSRRALLFDLDTTVQQLALHSENAREVTRLTGTYHNLIREWADA